VNHQAQPVALDPRVLAPQILQLGVKYLLYERAEETALSQAFVQLVTERHKEFHAERGEDWRQCPNQVCSDARAILAQQRRREIYINPLGAKLMERYVVGFLQSPNQLVLRLTEKNEAQLPDTNGEKRAATSGIIIPS
jgi:hypothetical protein